MVLYYGTYKFDAQQFNEKKQEKYLRG